MLTLLALVSAKSMLTAILDLLRFDQSSGLTEPQYDTPVQMQDDELNTLMSNNTFVVFGTSTCGFTRKAIDILKERNESYVFVDKDRQMRDTYERLKSSLRYDTLPLIIKDGALFGGYTRLLKMYGGDKKENGRKDDRRGSVSSNDYYDYYNNGHSWSESASSV